MINPSGLFLTPNEGDYGTTEIECEPSLVAYDFRGVLVQNSIHCVEWFAERTYLSLSKVKQLH